MCIESTCDDVVRILFLIKLQMAVGMEPKLLEHLGSEMWWEKTHEFGSRTGWAKSCSSTDKP